MHPPTVFTDKKEGAVFLGSPPKPAPPSLRLEGGMHVVINATMTSFINLSLNQVRLPSVPKPPPSSKLTLLLRRLDLLVVHHFFVLM
jgi:hypothetical protein